jgi:hypothetical protein
LKKQSERDRDAALAKSDVIHSMAAELEDVRQLTNRLKSMIIKLQCQIDSAHPDLAEQILDSENFDTEELVTRLRKQLETEAQCQTYDDEGDVQPDLSGSAAEQVARMNRNFTALLTKFMAVGHEEDSFGSGHGSE